MKRWTALLLAIFAGIQIARAQSSVFIYQGRLDTIGGIAPNGLYDFYCQLYDKVSAPDDALVSTTVTNSAVPVTNGLFTLNLDFGAAVFTGAERWLSIGIRTNNALNFTTLTPRQRIASTPYAIRSGTAASLASGSNQNFTGNISFNPVSGPPFNVGSSTKVPNLNADLIDGLDSTAFVLKAGDTMTGNFILASPNTLSFGNQVRQMLNLWDTQYGIGVQANATYFRSHNHFAWFKDGTHADGTFDPGAGGTRLMTLENNGRLIAAGLNSVAALNEVGFLFGNSIAVRAEANSLLGVGLSAQADDALGTAISASSANGYAGQFSGAVRVNYASPFNKPQLEIHDPNDNGFARLRMKTGSRPLWDIAVGSTGGLLQTNSLRFFSEGNGDVMSLSTNGNLFVRVLTITGGADITEPFKMSERDLPRGSVVVIDEENPGHLKLSSQSYDTRVAGIISGAGGVNPGLSLSQQGVMEGDQHVALTGRVYVQADASRGVIKPGDLLTSSDLPGHAMRVADHARAQGAILGKAMTGLKSGTGLVLVLVTLQ